LIPAVSARRSATLQYNTIQYKICKAPCCRGFRGATWPIYVCRRWRLRTVVASLALQSPGPSWCPGLGLGCVYGPSRTWNRLPTALRSPELSIVFFHSSASSRPTCSSSCGCRVPSSGADVTTASSAPAKDVQTRLDVYTSCGEAKRHGPPGGNTVQLGQKVRSQTHDHKSVKS